MFTATGVSATELRQKGRKVVRRAGKQVLLLSAGGKHFAIANRCPHEGYPLSEGTEGPGCVLTCNWHNWKFDLASGEALVGRDPVRTYAIELRDEEIFVDLTDPPAEQQKHRALEGLLVAITDNDQARMARAIVQAVANWDRPDLLKEISTNLPQAMRGISLETVPEEARLAKRGW